MYIILQYVIQQKTQKENKNNLGSAFCTYYNKYDYFILRTFFLLVLNKTLKI